MRYLITILITSVNFVKVKSTTTHKCSKYVMLTNMGCYSLTGIHKNIEPYLDHYITVSKSTTHGTM